MIENQNLRQTPNSPMSSSREIRPTLGFIDEYCQQFEGLFPEVRTFEAFKFLHLGTISDIKRKSLPAIAKAVGLENSQSLHHFLSESPWSANQLRQKRLELISTSVALMRTMGAVSSIFSAARRLSQVMPPNTVATIANTMMKIAYSSGRVGAAKRRMPEQIGARYHNGTRRSRRAWARNDSCQNAESVAGCTRSRRKLRAKDQTTPAIKQEAIRIIRQP
jgi:DDE superfamily endonuclease